MSAETPSSVASRLDHVRVQRSLHEEADVAAKVSSCARQSLRLVLEDANELLADDLALLLGIGDTREPREEALLRLHVDERHLEVPAERLHDLLGLVLAQEPVVDEDARQLIPHCLVHQQRRDRGVDAARERAQHPLGADGRADALDLLLDDSGRSPRGRRPGDLVQEVLQDLLTVRRVHDLGVELDAVQAARTVLEGGDRSGRRAGRHVRTRRRRGDGVAMAHPYGLLGRQVVEELRLLRLQLGLAELRGARSLDGATEVAGHELHPVADAERGDPEREDVDIELRRTVGEHRGRPTGEDQRCGVPTRDLRSRQAVPDELRVDTRLADASGDELAVLPAEVDDEDGALLRCGLGRRERDDLRHQRL